MNRATFRDGNGDQWKAEIVSVDRRAELEAGVIPIEDEDSRVAVDLNDAEHPIMVERDGRMPLADAKRLLRLLTTAIEIAEKRYPAKTNVPQTGAVSGGDH